MRVMIGIALVSGVMFGQPAMAQNQADICDRQARHASGYQGGRLPKFKIGPFTAQISGSVAVGVSRSSGNAGPSVPKGAGAGAREMREINQEREYRRHYEACMFGR